MIEKLLCTDCSRKNTDRELHLRDHAGFRKYGVTSALYTRLDEPPRRIPDNKPWQILDISNRFPAPGNAKYQPVGQHLYRRGCKISEDSKLGITHISQQFILCNTVDTVYVLEILR